MVEKHNHPAWWFIGLSLVVIVTSIDLFLDFATGVHLLHIVVESVVLALLGAIATAMWRARGRRIQALNETVKTLGSQVQDLGAEVVRWRSENEELMRGLGQAIDEQFVRWKLSGAEAEVALLLLKGLSLKEVASVRNTSERTARDQARAVYKKSELSGRSELSAFFLEDLLLPIPGSGARPGPETRTLRAATGPENRPRVGGRQDATKMPSSAPAPRAALQLQKENINGSEPSRSEAPTPSRDNTTPQLESPAVPT